MWIYIHFLLFSELKQLYFISKSNKYVSGSITVTHTATAQSGRPAVAGAGAQCFFTNWWF